MVPGLTLREAEMRLLNEIRVRAPAGPQPQPGTLPCGCPRHLAPGCVRAAAPPCGSGVPVLGGVGEGRSLGSPRRDCQEQLLVLPAKPFTAPPPPPPDIHSYIHFRGGGRAAQSLV